MERSISASLARWHEEQKLCLVPDQPPHESTTTAVITTLAQGQ